MVRPFQQSWQRYVVDAADTLFVLLVSLAGAIARAGAVTWHVGSLVLSAHSPGRALTIAALVAIGRHLVRPRPSLVDRVVGLPGALYAAWRNPARRAGLCSVIAVFCGLTAFAIDAGGPSGALRSSATAAAIVAVAALLGARGRAAASLEPAVTLPWPSPGEWLGAGLGLAAATALLLRDQVAMPTGVLDLGDPLLSAWRLGWFAHQLPLDAVHLFDANIYHPALRTLAYSDATLLQGAVAAPFVWLGAPLIIVYNGLLVASFFTAGLAMFALARAVTGSGGPAFVAAVAFAFDPYRIAEYSHFEMLFTCWMPLAVLMLLRTLARGRLRDGLGTGVFISLQALSSLYYGAFLSVSLVTLAVGWVWTRGWPGRRTYKGLAIAVLVPAIVAAALTQPYRANRATIGERGEGEIRFYSASMAHYLIASRQSAVYAMLLLDRRPDGLNLFTGATPLILGAVALVPPAGPFVAPVTVALLASVDASFGLNGTLYSWLVRLAPFHGFRVPARFRAVAGVYLSLLAGLGVARLRSPRVRSAVVVVGTSLLLVECYPTLELRPVWTHAPDIYAHLPKGAVLADLPLLEDSDSVFTYLSTFHWHPIVNGSSGFEPSWYGPLAAALVSFPEDPALDALARVGAQYVVLHEAYYRGQFAAISQAADAQPRLQFVAASNWEEGGCRLYRLVR